MRIGDLVRMTQYDHWGLGIVVALDETSTQKAALIQWADSSKCWRYIEDLEAICE